MDQAQAEVEPSGSSGAREHVAVVHVERCVFDPHPRVALGRHSGRPVLPTQLQPSAGDANS
jgi:hypothetical protein